jgi:hypothetical protein
MTCGSPTVEVDTLGPVRHLVSPNLLHHLFLGRGRHAGRPRGCTPLRGCAGAGAIWRSTPIAAMSPIPPGPPMSIEWCFAAASLMEEVVFFHRASRTALVGDLVQRFDPATLHGWRALVMRLLLNRLLNPPSARDGRLLPDFATLYRERRGVTLELEQTAPRRAVPENPPAITALRPKQGLPDQVDARRGYLWRSTVPIELRLDRRSMLAELLREQPELDHVLVAVRVRAVRPPPALFHVPEKPVETIRLVVADERTVQPPAPSRQSSTAGSQRHCRSCDDPKHRLGRGGDAGPARWEASCPAMRHSLASWPLSSGIVGWVRDLCLSF